MAKGARATIPIFPLASVVLFPKLRLPLYIFEPRYRQMTREALEGDRRIGMVTVKPESIEQTAGDPPVFATGCEAEIVDSELLPDGGYDIVLLGTCRFRISSEELPAGERLYRLAKVELLSDAPTSAGAVRDGELSPSETRAKIVTLLHKLLAHAHANPSGQASRFNTELFDAYDDELFVNALAQSVSFSASEKQGLIECDGVMDRLQQLWTLLEFKLAALRSGQSGALPLQ